MEGVHPTTPSESEGVFETEKSKNKRDIFERRPNSDAAALNQRRGLAALEVMVSEPARAKEGLAGSRQRAPEAHQLHGEQQAPEHIGHVLVSAEAAKRSREVQHEARVRLGSDKRIETLSRAELLALSEQIAFETSTLRNIYETHLIGEQALRRLVAEYLSGGDIKKALQREILEHEIDFERDPALRDMPIATDIEDQEDDNTGLIAPGREALERLLQKAEAGLGISGEEMGYDKAATAGAAARTNYVRERRLRRRLQRRSIDIIMGVTIVILIALVTGLYFWHR